MNPLFAEIFKDELETAEAEGAKNTLIANVRELMKNLHFNAAQVMDALEIPTDKQKEYLDLI